MSGVTVMIMAGGTGGHVFPGLAVAAELATLDRRVVWMGTRRGLEARVVPQAGIDIEWISISGVRGASLGGWLLAHVRILRAVAQALRILRRVQPTAVLGMGGFVAGPGGLAAWLTGRPLLIHEQNSVPGTTNRYLARLAKRVFEAFPGSFGESGKAVCIGNPVRADVRRVQDPLPRLDGRWQQHQQRRLLVLGGSQGAQALNSTVPAAIALLPAGKRPQVWHQCGNQQEMVEAAYRKLGVAAQVTPFIDDMAAAYGWADLAVCRSGALTLAELAAVGLGALLVPFPFAIDDHQLRNAQHFAAQGAARIFEESGLSPKGLAGALLELLGQPDRLMEMARLARSQDHPHAARQLAIACAEVSR